MKKRNLSLVIFLLFSFSPAVFSAPLSKELKTLTEQLQKNPSDSALREKIVRLAKKTNPTLPDDAEKYEGRGKFAFKTAKSPNDYLEAAKEFEKAVLSAPWISGYYSDLCTIYEKAEKYTEAKRNCEIYLKMISDKSELSETKQRIAGLEFGIEKSSLPQALVEQLQNKYGNRRVTAHHSCWITDGRKILTCNESESQGTTWAQGASDGSYSWMPIQTRAGSLDFTSLNLRFMFRLDGSNPNRIIMYWMDDGKEWNCGIIKGKDLKSIEWKDCSQNFSLEIRFNPTSNGKPMLELIKGCDAFRNCARDRWILE